jgi:hypothetical protein
VVFQADLTGDLTVDAAATKSLRDWMRSRHKAGQA